MSAIEDELVRSRQVTVHVPRSRQALRGQIAGVLRPLATRTSTTSARPRVDNAPTAANLALPTSVAAPGGAR